MIKSMTVVLLTTLTFSIFSSVNEFQHALPIPVKIQEESAKTASRYALIELNAPREKLEILTRGVYAASIGTEIDPVLIASIIKPESDFKVTALSPKGYKGLMQTRKSHRDWNWAEADIMEGACTLRDKLKVTKGDMGQAMVYYKGHGGKESQDIAKLQMKLYNDIKIKVSRRMEIKDGSRI